MNKAQFDYLGNLFSSRILAHKIEQYWASKGRNDVRAWVETEEFGPGKIYVIRSNIKLGV